MIFYLASTYGSGTYDSQNYSGATTTSGGGTATSSGGLLSNTGLDIAVIVTLAATLLLVAVVVHIWKRPAKRVDE